MHRNAETTFVELDGTATQLVLDLDCHQMVATAYLVRRYKIIAIAAARHSVAGHSRSLHLNLSVARTENIRSSVPISSKKIRVKCFNLALNFCARTRN